MERPAGLLTWRSTRPPVRVSSSAGGHRQGSPRRKLLASVGSIMECLNALEQGVLDKLLAGDHAALATLREQAACARLVSRELSVVGFFCAFEVPPEAPRLQGAARLAIGDVNAEVSGLKHGAGFVLFIRDGRLDMLEGFSYDEPWPRETGQFTLSYQREPRALELPEG
jgi:hypothetical protein